MCKATKWKQSFLLHNSLEINDSNQSDASSKSNASQSLKQLSKIRWIGSVKYQSYHLINQWIDPLNHVIDTSVIPLKEIKHKQNNALPEEKAIIGS